MLYSKQNKWVFIHVPKNAGTAIQDYIRSTDGKGISEKTANRKSLNLDLYMHGNPLLAHNKASYWSTYNFTKGLTFIGILRNPWARCLSLYLYNVKIASENLNEDWGRIDHGILTKQGFKQSWMEGGFFVDNHGIDFEYNKKTGRAWSQSDDQFSWLDGVSSKKWFRLEDELNDFCKFTKLPSPKVLNDTKKAHYRNHYDDELAERIATLFARDVELGGYKF